ncbi:MAG: SIS domain-containing protein [Acidimicrobiia bacterium]|nr:SIS domain-containing protein [Acidimicrobiia bacterium]
MTATDCVCRPVDAALWLARAFVQGRRLAVSAPGADDHAHHVAVEFVHPVVAGARALPATAGPRDETDAYLVIGEPDRGADLFIAGDLTDSTIIRTYHVLWELVQVALDHPGIAGGEGSAGGDTTGFLYPFLDAAEADEAGLRASLDASARAKRSESAALEAATLRANRDVLASVAEAAASTREDHRRILTMGNGGSATDAARLARRLRGVGLRAQSLSADYAVVTALANDLGAEKLFVRQLEAFGRGGDVLVGCSTSGSSPNLLAAFDRAAQMGLMTVGLSGYGGRTYRREPSVDHGLAVDSQSVHRIQEAQAALIDELCDRIRS